MITKEQALIARKFRQTHAYLNPKVTYPLAKPSTWRANGKCKTWKRDPNRFQLPIKYGLYEYAYITNENAELFEVAE